MRYLILLLGLYAASLAAAPRVVTSIAPVHELTAAIMRGAGEPELLIERGASPHHFSFRPSHLRRLERADLVIWIDRRFESGFARLPGILPARVARLELLPLLGARGDDGHIWYSARRLLVAVGLIRDELIRLDPPHADLYRDNAAELGSEIERWRERLARELGERRVAVLTDHAFLDYLGAEFGALAIASIHDRHDNHGGIRHLHEIEAWLREQRPRCLLSQESMPAALADRLAREFGLEVIDIESPGASGGEPGIVARLERLRAALERCATAQ